MELYGEKDFETAKRTTITRFVIEAVLLLAFIGLIAASVTAWRSLPLVMVISGIGGAILYFNLTVKVMPWFRYWRYQTDIKNGRTHEMDCRFVSASEGERISDGVAFREFAVALDEELEDSRLLFWDADKEMPALEPGSSIHVRLFGNYIIALETI